MQTLYSIQVSHRDSKKVEKEFFAIGQSGLQKSIPAVYDFVVSLLQDKNDLVYDAISSAVDDTHYFGETLYHDLKKAGKTSLQFNGDEIMFLKSDDEECPYSIKRDIEYVFTSFFNEHASLVPKKTKTDFEEEYLPVLLSFDETISRQTSLWSANFHKLYFPIGIDADEVPTMIETDYPEIYESIGSSGYLSSIARLIATKQSSYIITVTNKNDVLYS